MELCVLTQSHDKTFRIFDAVETGQNVSQCQRPLTVKHYVQNKPIGGRFIFQVASKQLDTLDGSKAPSQSIEIVVRPTKGETIDVDVCGAMIYDG